MAKGSAAQYVIAGIASVILLRMTSGSAPSIKDDQQKVIFPFEEYEFLVNGTNENLLTKAQLQALAEGAGGYMFIRGIGVAETQWTPFPVEAIRTGNAGKAAALFMAPSIKALTASGKRVLAPGRLDMDAPLDSIDPNLIGAVMARA